MKKATLFLCAFALSVAAPAAGEPTSRAYEPNDHIPVWTHSVSPFANPQERYRSALFSFIFKKIYY